jgi:hypothetical protein
MNAGVNILYAQMIMRRGQGFDDSLTADGNPVSTVLDLTVPPLIAASFSTGHTTISLMGIISNNKPALFSCQQANQAFSGLSLTAVMDGVTAYNLAQGKPDSCIPPAVFILCRRDSDDASIPAITS